VKHVYKLLGKGAPSQSEVLQPALGVPSWVGVRKCTEVTDKQLFGSWPCTSLQERHDKVAQKEVACAENCRTPNACCSKFVNLTGGNRRVWAGLLEDVSCERKQ
jgi:hypothetical protein